MTQELLDRIAELEEMKEFDELDEDEREELRDLKEVRSQERKQGKALAAWGKAKQVYKLTDNTPAYERVTHDGRIVTGGAEDPLYALTELPLREIARHINPTEFSIERVERPVIGNLGYDSVQEIFWDLDTEQGW